MSALKPEPTGAVREQVIDGLDARGSELSEQARLDVRHRERNAAAGCRADRPVPPTGSRLLADRLGGRLDIIVNNAGISEHGTIGALSDDAFDRLLNVNVRGVWHTTSAAVAHLGEAGRIINIGSCFSERLPYPGARLPVDQARRRRDDQGLGPRSGKPPHHRQHRRAGPNRDGGEP